MMKTRTLQLTLVVSAFVSPLGSTTEQGEALYAEHCATCHAVSLREGQLTGLRCQVLPSRPNGRISRHRRC